MAYRKQFPRSKRKGRASKPVMKRAKKVMARTKKVKAQSNKDTMFVSCKANVQLVPQQGVTVANYLYTNFQLLSAPSSTQACSVVATDQFKVYQALYDRVRVNSITVVIKRRANVLDAATSQNDAQFNVSGTGQVHTAIDRDSALPWVGGTGLIAAWQQMGSYRNHKMYDKGAIVRKYSIKYPRDIWLDTGNIFSDDTLLNRLGLLGNIGIYGENFIEENGEIFNEPWANAYIYWNCVFQGRKPQSVAVDASGNVIYSPIEYNPADKAKETISRFPTQDASGNQLDLSGNVSMVS